MKKSPDQILQDFYNKEGEFSLESDFEAEEYLKVLYSLKKSPIKDSNE